MKNGQVFTPGTMVIKMLDDIGYIGKEIRGRTIFEPSFGDGAFLKEIVHRIINEYNGDKELICKELNNVYGVEIDKNLYDITLVSLNEILADYGIYGYTWNNLVCGDALEYKSSIFFDFIIGNPPYIRVHDLTKGTREKLKEFELSKGNLDLYVIFFELCMYLLNERGKLCFITPNSYFLNNSQKGFRDYLVRMNLLKEIWDYTDVKLFSADTYTVVTLIDRAKENKELVYHYMSDVTTDEYISKFDIDIWRDKLWYFDKEENVQFLFSVLDKTKKLGKICDIQFGIETNANKVYVVDSKCIEAYKLEKEYLRPVIKASTLDNTDYIIFPYKETENGFRIVEEAELKKLAPGIYQYFLDNQEILRNRDMDKGYECWYQYARSQGIQNSKYKKIVFKQYLSNDLQQCEILECDESTLVYSGIYIVVKKDKDYGMVKDILLSEELHRYLMLVGKSISGGYKNINTKMLKEYGYK